MKAIWAALKDFVLTALVKISFTDIILGAVSGFTGFWGKIISFVLRPFLSGLEKGIDEAITKAQTEEKSDASIDQAAQTHLKEINQAKTDDETDQAFRDSLR